jgi:hypothetical protein
MPERNLVYGIDCYPLAFIPRKVRGRMWEGAKGCECNRAQTVYAVHFRMALRRRERAERQVTPRN